MFTFVAITTVFSLKYPQLTQNAELSTSVSHENKLWQMRHEISDSNRNWAKANNLSYIGYDIGIPKKNFAEVLKKMNRLESL